jgi:hypothetical protein
MIQDRTLARNLKCSNTRGNFKDIPDRKGQPGQKPGFIF